MKNELSVRSMTFTALMSALICVSAPIVIPLGAVPLSLATLAVYITGAVLGCKKATASVSLYLIIGMIGLPVFSGFTGGLGQILGVTGGFLVGYIPCAFITGIFCDMFPDKLWSYAIGMALGTLSCYLIGMLWYMLITEAGLAAALMVCVIPFIPADAIKIAAACAISIPLKKRLSAS